MGPPLFIGPPWPRPFLGPPRHPFATAPPPAIQPSMATPLSGTLPAHWPAAAPQATPLSDTVPWSSLLHDPRPLLIGPPWSRPSAPPPAHCSDTARPLSGPAPRPRPFMGPPLFIGHAPLRPRPLVIASPSPAYRSTVVPPLGPAPCSLARHGPLGHAPFRPAPAHWPAVAPPLGRRFATPPFWPRPCLSVRLMHRGLPGSPRFGRGMRKAEAAPAPLRNYKSQHAPRPTRKPAIQTGDAMHRGLPGSPRFERGMRMAEAAPAPPPPRSPRNYKSQQAPRRPGRHPARARGSADVPSGMPRRPARSSGARPGRDGRCGAGAPR
ncbi:vegetative cell wall protein gp1-like [Tachyglossus aculeatus]|uniref:vegetative cell wall protein gp1-like n=1 Tax=Tachyglossus aculeatus TaxID=9261 RepID=UPI0018F6CB50|nr:vegetative cell wall protein gp1-like [Tachyglossus aculeatus]